jgi:hypothetical protein
MKDLRFWGGFRAMVAARSKTDLGRAFTHIHDQEIEMSERVH